MSSKTPAKVTVKVATTNSAAKDDAFSSADYSWLSENGSLKGNLAVLANDPGSASLYSVSSTAPAGTGVIAKEEVGSTDTFAVTYNNTNYSGKLTLNADGTVGFDLSSLAGLIDGLAQGQKITTEFYYTARMANGVLSTSKVTISIDGTNDDPTMSAVAQTITDGVLDDDFGTVTGTLVGADVDTGAVLIYGLAAGQTGVSAYGTLTVNPDGTWSFVPDDAAINGLKGAVPVVFNVAVTDEHGAIGLSTITINLAGADDVAEFGGDDGGNVVEDGTLTASGTLTVADRDAVDVGFDAAASPATFAGTYGDFTFDAATGTWTYTLRNGDANVQALTSSSNVTDSMTVYSAGGNAKTIVVNVAGGNEAPTWTYDSPDAVNTGTGDPNNKDGEATNAAVVRSGNAGNNPHYNGTAGNDTITGAGDPGNNKIYAGAGNDILNGDNGNDEIWGGSGNDTINGGNGGDTIWGGDGIDTIHGDGGADKIIGGFGADILYGDGGADTFIYRSANDTGDTIMDFSRVEGDKIDLSAFSPNSWKGVLTQAGAVGANEVGFMYDASTDRTTIYVDTDGVFGADLEINVVGNILFTADDFLMIPPPPVI
jgi:VCBS repeat-containing protein